MKLTETIRSLRDAKLTTGVALLILAGIVGLVYLVLGVSVLRARAQSDALASQVAAARDVLATAGGVQDDLDRLPAALDDARQRLARAERAFPTELDPNDVLEVLLGQAEASGVRVIAARLEPAGAAEGDQPQQPSAYQALDVSLQAEGSLDSLVGLLLELESETGATAVVSYAAQSGDGERTIALQLRSFARAAAATPAPVGDEESDP